MLQIFYHATINKNRPDLPEDERRCPAALRQLISEAWSPSPNDRPTAHDICERLAVIQQLVRASGAA